MSKWKVTKGIITDTFFKDMFEIIRSGKETFTEFVTDPEGGLSAFQRGLLSDGGFSYIIDKSDNTIEKSDFDKYSKDEIESKFSRYEARILDEGILASEETLEKFISRFRQDSIINQEYFNGLRLEYSRSAEERRAKKAAMETAREDSMIKPPLHAKRKRRFCKDLISFTREAVKVFEKQCAGLNEMIPIEEGFDYRTFNKKKKRFSINYRFPLDGQNNYVITITDRSVKYDDFFPIRHIDEKGNVDINVSKYYDAYAAKEMSEKDAINAIVRDAKEAFERLKAERTVNK